MKINKMILICSLVLISLLAISAASAAEIDDLSDASIADSDIAEVEPVDDVQIIGDTIDQKSKNILSDDKKQISISTKDTPYNENASVEISANKEILTNESVVSIYLNGAVLANVTLDAEGKGVYNIPAGSYDVGDYYLKAILNNDGVELSDGILLNITKVTPVISVNDLTFKSGEIVTIPINVTDGNGKHIAGDVIVTISGEGGNYTQYIRITNETSYLDFDLSGIIGILDGNSSNSSFNISSIISNLFGNVTNGTNGTNVSSIISNLFGNVTNGTNVSSIIGDFLANVTNGTNVSSIIGDFLANVTNGTNVSSIISNLFGNVTNGTNVSSIIGDFLANVTNGTNSSFNISSIINNLFGNVTNGTNSSFDLGALIGSLLGNITNGTNGSNSSFDIGSIISSLLGGNTKKAEFAYLFKNGTYNITVTYLPSRNYGEATNNTAKLTITPLEEDVFAKKVSVIEYEDMNTTSVNTKVDGRIGEYFTATLKDKDGNILANKSVQIGFNGKVYNRTTNETGGVALQINLPRADIYTFAICFLGDEDYNGSFVVAKITVSKQTAKLTASNKSFKASAKTKTISATFKSAKGNAISGKKITFTVNGKTYSAKTNDKGVASVKVSINKKGTYSFTAKFAGDDYYASVSKKATLTLK